MKVAAMIAGLPRFTKEFDLFLENLVGYDQIDWFFYFWNDYKDPFVSPDWPLDDINKVREKLLSNLPNNHCIKHLSINAMPQYINTKSLNLTIWSNEPHIWYMHKGLKCVTEIREQYEKDHGPYDIVIRARGDVGLAHQVNFADVKNFLIQFPDSILTPANHRLGLMGKKVCEALAIGNSKTMSTFCRVVDHLYEYNDKGVLYHPETLTAHHLAVNNIKTPMTNFHFLFRHFKTPDGRVDWGRWR